jgi:hypothetical protein
MIGGIGKYWLMWHNERLAKLIAKFRVLYIVYRYKYLRGLARGGVGLGFRWLNTQASTNC